MKKIMAIALALVMVVAFSAVAFADRPKGNGPMGGHGMGGQMQMGGGPQGDLERNGQQPPEMPNGEASQGDLEQNGQQPPEMPNGKAPRGGMNGQNGPKGGPGMGGQDPINALFDAVNALEDETVRANIEALMQAEFDAIVAERDAEDKEAAAEAVAAAREALQNALAEAGIEFTFPELGGQQPPELSNK